MKDHTDLLNHIAAKIGAKTYLEIGVFNPDHNFNHIKVPHKIGVDPETGADLKWTSDKFFDFARAAELKVDLSWIDGLHHEEQVIRDILGAWEITRPGGVIALHDTNPPTEATTCIPRGRQREWCGDVYKAIAKLSGVDFFTVNFDYGVTILRKLSLFEPFFIIDRPDLTWKDFEQDRDLFLGLVPLEKALEYIETW